MKKKVVYWGVFSDYAKNSLFDLEPKSLIKDLAESQKNFKDYNYVACPAIRDKHKNTFVTYFPYDLKVEFTDTQCLTNRPNEIVLRDGLYKDSYSFNFEIERIFYCEESQLMETSPAFLHNTSYSNSGHAPSGSFDIGKWFRQSSPNFQLWPGVTSFKAMANEPHMYFNFPDKNNIILKKFYVSDKLKEFAFANISMKNYIPKQNLNSLYSRFIKSNQKSIILNEINKNLF
jgi:hypothetical protein